MMDKCVHLVFSFDICSNFDVTEDAISLILENLQEYEDSYGEEMKITWFIRADNQLESFYGDEGYLLEKYFSLWNDLSKEGHEIGWHPHIYRLFGEKWVLETKDEYLGKNLIDSFNKISKYYTVSSVRMGESFHSNGCMKILDRLGLKVDSTALPNRKRKDGSKNFDWADTPDHPYHPSKKNYRMPGKDNFKILEVPMTMVPIKTSYDVAPLERYLDLAFHSILMEGGIEHLTKTRNLLIITTHPYELVPNQAEKQPLVSFDIKEAKKNVNNIIHGCKKNNKSYKFITMSEVPDVWEVNSKKVGE